MQATKTATPSPTAPAQGEVNGRAAAPAVASTRLRRRPMLTLVSVGLVLLGAIAGLVVWSASTTTTEVVAARLSVDRGAVITAEDLMIVRTSLDPSLQVVPGEGLSGLVGMRAASDITAGSLVNPAQVMADLVPATGESVVGVALSVGKLPAEQLRPGDRVRLVQTPLDQSEVPDTQITIDAIVQGVSAPAADGMTVVVDLIVPSSRAPEVAARAATGRVALVLDSRER